MITQRTPDGGQKLELNGGEARLLRDVAEKARFMDTPHDRADQHLRVDDDLIPAQPPPELP